jgi:hypothetical protein
MLYKEIMAFLLSEKWADKYSVLQKKYTASRLKSVGTYSNQWDFKWLKMIYNTYKILLL